MNKTSADLFSYFNEKLIKQFDKEEIEAFYFLTCEKFLNFSRLDLRLKAEMVLQEDVVKKFVSVVDELLTNKPIQYILGQTEFYGLTFEVDENVLIPRQETEELVDWIISDVAKSTKVAQQEKLSIVDIGTGSACIPVSLKKNLETSKLIAIDVSKGALLVAEHNAKLNKVEIQFIEADILNSDFDPYFTPNSLDIIVSNPPYVRHSEQGWMHKNVIDFEPHLALFVADEKPLLFYVAIAIFANKYLKSRGRIYFEINEALGSEITLMLAEKGFDEIVVKKDLNGKDRMVRAIKI